LKLAAVPECVSAVYVAVILAVGAAGVTVVVVGVDFLHEPEISAIMIKAQM
jgi:hypothetical protein